jgi:hypothetical protein
MIILFKTFVVGGWKGMHNKWLHNLYALLNIRVIKLRRMRCAGNVTHIGEMQNAYKILVRKLEGKRQLRRPGIGSKKI